MIRISYLSSKEKCTFLKPLFYAYVKKESQSDIIDVLKLRLTYINKQGKYLVCLVYECIVYMLEFMIHAKNNHIAA